MVYGLDNARLCVARGMQEHDQEITWHPPPASMLLSNHELVTQADGVVRRTGVTPVMISACLDRDTLSRSTQLVAFSGSAGIGMCKVEYAIEAVKHGSTVIGIETTEGVVLAVEKRLTSPLLEPKSIEKIMEIDEHVGCAMSGLTADARTLVDRARVECMVNHTANVNRLSVC